MRTSRIALIVTAAASTGVLAWLVAQTEERAQPPSSIEVTASAGSTPRSSDLMVGHLDDGSHREVWLPIPVDSTVVSDENQQPVAPALSTVIGKVVDDVNAPVRQCEVEARRRNRPELNQSAGNLISCPISLKVDSEGGRFVIERLSPGEWELVAHRGTKSRSAPVTVSVPATGDEVLLVLPRTGSVEGTVRSLTGLAIASASVFVDYPGKDSTQSLLHRGQSEPEARTDTEGRFAIEAVQPGAIRLMATHFEYSDGEWTQVRLEPGARVVAELRLSQGGRIVGLIDGSAGSVADRQVHLFSFRGPSGWRSTHSDEAGRFEIAQVMPQDYVIELRTVGYPDVKNGPAMESIRKQITVREGETTEVFFGSDPASIRVVGHVLRDGTPVEGFRVGVRAKAGSDDRDRHCRTGPSGRFELFVEEPGEYTFSVSSAQGGAVFDRTVGDGGESNLVLDVPTGRITGTVRAPNGVPLAHVPLTIVKDMGTPMSDPSPVWPNYRRLRTGSDGSFDCDMIESGTYILRAPDGFWSDRPAPRTPHGGVVIRDVRVDKSPSFPVLVQLEEEGLISVQVIDDTNRPVAGAFVQVLDSSGISRFAVDWELRTDVTGSLRAESIAPGMYTVKARTKGLVGTSVVVVEAGKTVRAKVEVN